MDETNQHLALELWGRKWNLIIWGVKSYVKDKRFESPRGTLHLVQAFLHETLGSSRKKLIAYSLQQSIDWNSGVSAERILSLDWSV
jgi:hypothetical protein